MSLKGKEQQTQLKSGATPSSEGNTSVQIPNALAERIKRRLPKTDFKSVDEYVSYVLEQMLLQLEEGEGKKTQDESAFSKEDQESVEQRLRDLGYL